MNAATVVYGEGEGGTTEATITLPAAATSPALARATLRAMTGGRQDTHAAVVLSEIVTDAVRHGEGSPQVRLTRTGRLLLIEVWDAGGERPVVRAEDPSATSGRGLILVDAMALRWGVTATGGGKTVWAEVLLEEDPERRSLKGP